VVAENLCTLHSRNGDERAMKYNNCHQQVNEVLDYIESQLHHSYLKQYLMDPIIDIDRINLLLLPFWEEDRNDYHIVQCVSTAMLIQIALDTHDKVTNSMNEPLKERQLTVLAGDYFSGLYYKILAETNDVPLINALAKATKKVNESKISIYKNANNDLENLLYDLKTMESAIITNFLYNFNQTQWIELSETILVIKRLLSEREMLVKGTYTPFTSSLRTLSIYNQEQQILNDEKERILHQLNKNLDHYRETLSELSEKMNIPSEYLSNKIDVLLDHPQPIDKIFVEEG
jgi:heptaprenyl diphosphate synthase